MKLKFLSDVSKPKITALFVSLAVIVIVVSAGFLWQPTIRKNLAVDPEYFWLFGNIKEIGNDYLILEVDPARAGEKYGYVFDEEHISKSDRRINFDDDLIVKQYVRTEFKDGVNNHTFKDAQKDDLEKGDAIAVYSHDLVNQKNDINVYRIERITK